VPDTARGRVGRDGKSSGFILTVSGTEDQTPDLPEDLVEGGGAICVDWVLGGGVDLGDVGLELVGGLRPRRPPRREGRGLCQRVLR